MLQILSVENKCCLKPFNVAKIKGLPVGLIVSIRVTADATRS